MELFDSIKSCVVSFLKMIRKPCDFVVKLPKEKLMLIVLIIINILLAYSFKKLYAGAIKYDYANNIFRGCLFLIVQNAVIFFIYNAFMFFGLSTQSKIRRIAYWIISSLLLLTVMVDQSLYSVLSARLDLHKASQFIVGIKESIKVLLPFFSKSIGRLWIILLVIHCFALRVAFNIKLVVKRKKLVETIICVLLFASFIWPFKVDMDGSIFDYKFYNIFKANVTGDLIPVSNKYLANVPMQDTHLLSSNQVRKKNVIVLIIESFSSYQSKYFGLGAYNNTPYIDMLAKENMSFLEHYSNGYNTNAGVFSILTGRPFIHGGLNMFDEKLYQNALPKFFAKKGYSTSVIYSASDIGGLDKIYKKSSFHKYYGDKESEYEKVERLTFNAVPDEYLLNHALKKYQKYLEQGEDFFSVIMTSTTHGPYVMPKTKEKSYDKTMRYTDKCVYDFVRNLENRNFFDNGILVITGDHRAMLALTHEEISAWGYKALARVPMIIIDKEIGARKYTHITSHSSINPTVQYLALGSAELYNYQDLLTNEKNELVIYQKLSPRDQVYIIDDGIENTVNLKGDYTSLNKKDDDKHVIDVVNWLRFY